MAMDNVALGKALQKAVMQAIPGGPPSITTEANLSTFQTNVTQNVAAAIINHLMSNMELNGSDFFVNNNGGNVK
jgi:hypothetical protein